MSYTPAFTALFEAPLLQQVIAVIQRDQVNAIAVVNARRAALGTIPGLGPIREFHLGPGRRTKLPWLAIGADAALPDEDAPLVSADTVHFALTLDVGQFDNEQAQLDAADYARMLRLVILSANLQPQNAGPADAWTGHDDGQVCLDGNVGATRAARPYEEGIRWTRNY
jgi:hypothetical protein